MCGAGRSSSTGSIYDTLDNTLLPLDEFKVLAGCVGQWISITNSLTSAFVNSRTLLMECANLLGRGVGAPHQRPIGLVADHLIYADVCTLCLLIIGQIAQAMQEENRRNSRTNKC